MQRLAPDDPQRIGAYRLLARLGAGGMGQVYLARSDRGRTVAVKLVRQELAQQEEFRARFRQEVQAARRVGGHWTAPVLDADTEAAVPWVATGYVAGPSLQQVVGHDHGPLPERSVRILAAGLAGALKDIHAAGLVHRDLKPSNVLVTIDGPRVIDFGIARALETVTDGGLTRTGALVGSPGFMAPEQVRGDRITPACDVFCLGSVLAYAATGALPFGGADSGVHALMYRIAEEEPDLEGVPEGIADLVRDCLRKDPAARPTLDQIVRRTGAGDTVADGRLRDPWLPGALVAQLGRHAVRLLDAENPEDPQRTPGGGAAASAGAQRAGEEAAGPAQPADGAAPAGAAPAGAAPAGAGPRGGTAVAGTGPAQGAQGAGTPGAAAGTPPAGPAGVPQPPASPEHAAAPPPPGQPGGAGHVPVGHLPTMAAGQAPPPGPAPAHPAYGYPRPHPQPVAHGRPQQPGHHPYGDHGGHGGYGDHSGYGGHAGHGGHVGHGGLGPTPPYGPPPFGSTPPYGPNPLSQQEPRRSARSTAALIAVALVVALGAGGSVYALMRGDGSDTRGGGPGPSPTAGVSTAPVTEEPQDTGPAPSASQPSSSAPADGVVPAAYLGSWTATIDSARGAHTRRLAISQGKVGDTVLRLVADGPTDGGGTYHCVFEARLTRRPSAGGPLAIGPSTVTTGPSGTCSPGEATEVTLLPDGRLQRVNTTTGESLTYTRQ
ncbi:serine/threonine-protein kinase [Streptomyces sp. LB8]|uniref:serine/threonine-protein kinase n=1 Tax=Streptomyces sp. LB8 TaxID=3042509 RepID=UPI0026491075|nr:serine/threonine-protein kinase [Streptomyces sp. LB8]MDN5382791.1 serine/threonine-protein kinase [Streptomyces sp. LB8]